MINIEQLGAGKQTKVSQAMELSRLIANQKFWLEEVQTGTVRRYDSVIKGFKSINRALEHRKFIESNVVIEDSKIIGMATAIFDQQLVHPKEGTYSGADIDYWIEMGQDEKIHNEVAAQLSDKYNANSVIATVRMNHPNPAIGFYNSMETIGAPASLSTGEAPDLFDISWGGQLVQLFASSGIDVDTKV